MTARVIPVTVRAVDAFGNTVTNYAGTAAFTSTDAQATLPAAYTFTPADAGTHTFTVGLHTATKPGQFWSVGAADAANPATLVTIPGFEVVNGVAAVVGVTLPTQITAGIGPAKILVNNAGINQDAMPRRMTCVYANAGTDCFPHPAASGQQQRPADKAAGIISPSG